MKYLVVLLFSVMVPLIWLSHTIGSRFWYKFLYNKEYTKKEKKIEFIIVMIVWAVLTIAAFVYVGFFVD